MEFLIENWYVIFALAAMIVFIGFLVTKLLKSPSDVQLQALKEWLKYAVTLAEKELGSGTGQLKLRYVYDLALTKFKWVATIYTFDEFSKDVDNAIIWLEKQLDTNKAITNMVKGE